MTLEQIVLEVLRQQMAKQVDSPPIALTDRLIDDLKLDSLDIVEISMNLETEFDIDIPDETAGTIKTVDDLVNMIRTIVKKKI